jgi:hypothetical protein
MECLVIGINPRQMPIFKKHYKCINYNAFQYNHLGDQVAEKSGRSYLDCFDISIINTISSSTDGFNWMVRVKTYFG